MSDIEILVQEIRLLRSEVSQLREEFGGLKVRVSLWGAALVMFSALVAYMIG